MRPDAIIPNDGRPLSLERAFIRRTTLRRAILRRANLTRADMTGVDAREADFKDAIMRGTILIAADLRGAKNLTAEQLATAVIDETTRLPHHITSADILAARASLEEGEK